MADSLAAIKKLVFDEKRITPAELWDALVDDFQSPESQRIQSMLVNDAPKYGNDDDSVDQLVVDAYDSYIDEIAKYPNTRHGRGPIGGIRYAGTSSISANVGQGMGTMATPDGRRAHEPLAEGCSPAHNADTHGPHPPSSSPSPSSPPRRSRAAFCSTRRWRPRCSPPSATSRSSRCSYPRSLTACTAITCSTTS